MTPNNWFYKLMYQKRTIKLTAESGHNYIVEYRRSPFWTNEDCTLKNFFKQKFTLWHGQVWLVYANGGSCGFGTWSARTLFPRRKMKGFLKAEVWHLEKILGKENENV